MTAARHRPLPTACVSASIHRPPPALPQGLRQHFDRTEEMKGLLKDLRGALDISSCSPALMRHVLLELQLTQAPDDTLAAFAEWLMPPRSTAAGVHTHDASVSALLPVVLLPRARAREESASRQLLNILMAAVQHYQPLALQHFVAPLLGTPDFGPFHAEVMGRLAKEAFDPETLVAALHALPGTSGAVVWTEHVVQALHTMVSALVPHSAQVPEPQLAAAMDQLAQGLEVHAMHFATQLKFCALLLTLATKLGPAVTPNKSRLLYAAKASSTFLKRKVLAAIEQL